MTHLGYRRQGACDGESFHDVCTDVDCVVCSLWQKPDESREAWLARIRRAYQAGGWVATAGQRAPSPQVQRARSAMLELISADTWTPATLIAARLGRPYATVITALERARECGAPIESSRHGWRRTRKEQAA